MLILTLGQIYQNDIVSTSAQRTNLPKHFNFNKSLKNKKQKLSLKCFRGY